MNKKKIYEFNTIVDLKESAETSLNVTEGLNDLKNSITVEIEAIHEMTTANHTTYPAKALRGSEARKTGAYSWTYPYDKPVLTHHNSRNGEPIGRVIGAEFKNSSKAGPPTILLTAEITDSDAVEKVNDGRYETVSIGGRAKHAYCSICGHDWVQDGYCEHWPGRDYEIEDGKVETAHLIMEDLTFDEVSFVNVPADKYAKIVNEAFEDAEEDNNKAKTKESNNINSFMVEGMFENSKGGYRMTLEEKVEVLEDKISTKEEKVEVLEGKIDNLENSNKTLEEEVSDTKEKLEIVEEQKELLENEVDELTEENDDLKEKQHRYLAEKVVQKKLEMSKISEENYDEVLEDHIDRTEDSLNDTLKDLKAEEEVEESSEIGEQVDNPGLDQPEEGVDNESNSSNERVKNIL